MLGRGAPRFPVGAARQGRAAAAMFSWLGSQDRGKKEPEVFHTVSEGLKKLYKNKLLPLEEHYRFHEFHSSALEDADFDNKPMILLVGQYSTGKTSFIRWVQTGLRQPTLPPST